MLFPVSTPPRLRLPGTKEKRSATWLELFFDLVFVIAVTELVHRLDQQISLLAIAQFIALFIPLWWCWVGHTVYATRFDTDDIVHRLITLTMMCAGAVMAIQVPTAFKEGAVGFAAGYVLARLCLLLLYARARRHIPVVRQMTTLYISGFGLGVLLWAFSMIIPSPYRFLFWTAGILIEFITPWLGRRQVLQKAPLDTSHFPERFGLFTIIVLGETILAVVSGLSEVHWHWLSILAGIMAFILAASIWWIYFTFIHKADHQRRLGSGQPFIYWHLPLVISLAAVGVGVKNLIVHIQEPALPLEISSLVGVAAAVWLSAFLLLHYVSIQKAVLKFLFFPYAGGIVALLTIPLLRGLAPFYTLTGLTAIFVFLLVWELKICGGNKIDEQAEPG